MSLKCCWNWQNFWWCSHSSFSTAPLVLAEAVPCFEQPKLYVVIYSQQKRKDSFGKLVLRQKSSQKVAATRAAFIIKISACLSVGCCISEWDDFQKALENIERWFKEVISVRRTDITPWKRVMVFKPKYHHRIKASCWPMPGYFRKTSKYIWKTSPK